MNGRVIDGIGRRGALPNSKNIAPTRFLADQARASPLQSAGLPAGRVAESGKIIVGRTGRNGAEIGDFKNEGVIDNCGTVAQAESCASGLCSGAVQVCEG